MIQFLCPHCAGTIQAQEAQAGVTGPCPSCGQTVTAPGRDRVAREASILPEALPEVVLPKEMESGPWPAPPLIGKPGSTAAPVPAKIAAAASVKKVRKFFETEWFKASLIAWFVIFFGGWVLPGLFMHAPGRHFSGFASPLIGCLADYAVITVGSLLLALSLAGLTVSLGSKRFSETLLRVYGFAVVVGCLVDVAVHLSSHAR